VLASTPISFAFPPPVCQDRKLVVTVKPDRPSAQALNVNCSDASDRSLDFSVVSGPTHGTFRFTGQGQSVYTATPGYVGPDSVTFEASAGDQDSNVATVSIDVVKPPPVPPPPVRYAFEYNCMRGLAGGLRRGRVFDYVFKPDGGRGTRTPSDFSTASFIRNYFMEPDPARPHLAPGTSFPLSRWVAYADPRAWAVPRARTGCVLAGPSIHLTTRQWFSVSHGVVTRQPTHLRCRFQNTLGTLVPWGFGSRIDRVVGHYPTNFRRGRYTSARTFLNLTLKGARPTLAYDRTACRRVAPVT